jgi:Family of unknown function (DUF6544)
MRYLADLPWVPHAMLANPELEWRELDAQTVEVATRVGSARAAVRLGFDAAGDIVGAFADARPRPEGKASVPTPWGGVFHDYRVLDGIRVPLHAEVGWELPGRTIHLLVRHRSPRSSSVPESEEGYAAASS